MSRAANFVSEARDAARAVWNGINQLQALQKEWNALDYGNTLANTDAFEGQNQDITPAAVGSVIFDTAEALQVVLNAGNATNLARLL